MTDSNNSINPTAPVEKTSQPKHPRHWMNIAIILIFFLIVVLITGFFGANYYYMKNFTRITRAQHNVLNVQKNMEAVEQQVQQLVSMVKSQNNIINALRQTQSGYSRNEWRVIEAEFLVKLAMDKIHLSHQMPEAIILLQTADQAIRDINDARLLPLRKALATDIANLQAVPVVDVAGIYLRLSAMNEQIPHLPLPNKPMQALSEVKTSDNQDLPWWKRGLQQTWQGLRQIVIVRYNQQDKQPLVMPEQQDFLYQNIQAALEKAMWGLLHQQDSIYHASLQQATTWINNYFVVNAPATESVLSNLAQLQQMDIYPAVPTHFESLTAFQEYFVSRGIPADNAVQNN